MDQPPVPVLSGPAESYLDARQAADYLRISAKKLLQLARSHKVPAYGLGGARRKMWRFRRSELDSWMQSEVHSGSDQGRIQERRKKS
jgi:excisionase family DNA binding protein